MKPFEIGRRSCCRSWATSCASAGTTRGGCGSSWLVDETYLKVRGRWCYLYRAIGRDGNLVDAMLSDHRDMRAAKAFFRLAQATVGFGPDRVTTDGHDSYPRAIRTVLGRRVRHRTSAYLNNRLEQDRRGKGRIRCMRGLKSQDTAQRFCHEHGELRGLLRPVAVTSIPSPPPSAASASQEAPELHSGSCRTRDRTASFTNDQNSGAGADRT